MKQTSGGKWLRSVAIGCLLALSAAGAAQAESAQDRAAARDLFDEGRKLVKAGNYGAACPKFEESQRLDPGVGTLFNLADCYEHTGRTASAWAMFFDAATASRSAKEPEREQAARRRAQDLEPKLLRLSILVPAASETAGLEVYRDGTLVKKPMWGQAIPVDSGEHKIQASAAGRKSWSTSVSLSGEGKTETVTVPALDPDPSSAAPSHSSGANPSMSSTSTASVHPPSNADSSTSSWSSQKTIGLVAGGVGLLSFGVAGYFALNTKSKLSDADAYCNGTRCSSQKGVDLHDDAVKSADMATIFSGIGAVGLIGGAVLFLTAPSGRSASSASTRPILVAGPTSISLKGTW